MSQYDDYDKVNLKREELKAELMHKLALKSRQNEIWVRFKESTPLEDRIALDSEIAQIESDIQAGKVRLMHLKIEAKELREKTLCKLLLDALERNHLRDEVNAAMQVATDTLKHEGLLEAYRFNVK